VILLAAILVAVYVVGEPWGWAVLAAGCVLEVGEIAYLRRWSRRFDRRTKRTTGAEAMLGARGEVVSACRPNGTVRIRGELWEARCADGADPGDTVLVDAVDALTLVVSPG
jgi:membrane protein implicated in regulation of membrane protease activity